MVLRKFGRRYIVILAIELVISAGAILTLVYASSEMAAFHTSTSSTSTLTFFFPRSDSLSGDRWVKIRALNDNSTWGLGPPVNNQYSYDAQQVIGWINSLKPNVLFRFVSGNQDPFVPVPTCTSCAPMNIQQFLQASLDACASSRCVIVPRISLNEFVQGTLFTTSHNLLSMQLNPPMRYLSLDDWTTFAETYSPATVQYVLQQLYSQGWLGISISCDFASYTTEPYAKFITIGEACVNGQTWQPLFGQLGAMKNLSSIRITTLDFTFPTQVAPLQAMPTDSVASILQNLAGNQSQDGYVFVYTIIQGRWDATTMNTASSGEFHGASLLQVMNSLMQKFN